VLEMRGVRVRFEDGSELLGGLDWAVRRGQHYCVRGHNGVGKSLLLGLITGDTPQAFNNDVRLFGRERAALSLDAVRQHLGEVSARLQHAFARGSHYPALDMICTGYHRVQGSGPCPPCTPEQRARAEAWAAVLGLPARLLQVPFTALSQGQQRAALCARALLTGKQGALPTLLLLDEPFHGLDAGRRAALLHVLERIQGRTTIIIVSHFSDDIPNFVQRTLELPSPHHTPSRES
jgi:molybdate transport system ATP-binding protein